MTAPRPRPRGMRRAIVILPSAFTSGNLFFGVWSIVESTRGNFALAAWFIIAAAVLDLLDGRVARMSRTGSAFGAELDSLVDVVSFGVAPAMLLYFWRFRGGEWAWLLSFIYVLAAALRLARFNVVQAGQAKTHFIGLSSPISGITLASSYPFTQTAVLPAAVRLPAAVADDGAAHDRARAADGEPGAVPGPAHRRAQDVEGARVAGGAPASPWRRRSGSRSTSSSWPASR